MTTQTQVVASAALVRQATLTARVPFVPGVQVSFVRLQAPPTSWFAPCPVSVPFVPHYQQHVVLLGQSTRWDANTRWGIQFTGAEFGYNVIEIRGQTCAVWTFAAVSPGSVQLTDGQTTQTITIQ